MSTTINSNLPALSNEGGLSAYLEQIKKSNFDIKIVSSSASTPIKYL